jgi:hypothetical protein
VIEVTKIIYDGDRIKVDYCDGKGSYKMSIETSGDNEPSPDLTRSISKLTDIFASRVDLEDRRQALSVAGLETGTDPRGDWYKVRGAYIAHMFEHELVTGKLREMRAVQDPCDGDILLELEDADEKEDRIAEEYPSLLTSEELDLILSVLVEARLFVEGKRAQLKLDFEGGDGEETDDSGEDEVGLLFAQGPQGEGA